jgi:predicted SprT family Zn-dependent metalloprotease
MKKKTYMRKVTRFFWDYAIKSGIDTSNLELRFSNKIGYLGEAWKEGNHYTVTLAFFLDIFEEIIVHELCHITQFQDGRLEYINNKPHWLGVDYSNTNYWECPWEKEAYLQQTIYSLEND